MASKIFSTLLLLSTIGDALAFWRMECRGRTGLARIDPIMDAGLVSPHIHTVHGSSGTYFLPLTCAQMHLTKRTGGESSWMSYM